MFYGSADAARKRGNRSLHRRVDVAVEEVGQRAVLLEGVKERGVRTGQSEYTAITMKSVDEFGEGEAGGVVDVVG